MAKSLSILYVSTELYPFAKVTGIGDIAYSFPLAVREVGHDIRVMIPKYGSVSERRNRIHEINRLRDIPIAIGGESYPATVKSSSISNTRAKVQAYITTNQHFFDSKRGIYNDPQTWMPYPDNHLRYIYFNKTVIETCLLLGWFPDIIHLNGWQSALIPGLARTVYQSKFKKTKFLFTIHNIAEQGIFPDSDYAATGLPKEAKNNYKHKKENNFLKGGIYYSDYITTVSEAYAREILKDKDYSNGLNAILKEKQKVFKGVSNRIDHNEWNPQTDINLKHKLRDNIPEYKEKNKKHLAELCKFSDLNNQVVACIIADLKDENGYELIMSNIEKIMKENLFLVICGEGTKEQKAKLEKSLKKYTAKIKFFFEINDLLSRQIYAGSDLFLSLAKHEPCGLNMFYALRYGAVPIAYSNGTISEYTVDYDKTNSGNSFVFDKYEGAEFLKALKKAMSIYKINSEWQKVRDNGMAGDYSWHSSALIYDEIYKQIMKD